MNKIMTLIYVIVLLSFVGCDTSNKKIKQDFQRTNQELRIVVIFHANERELNQSYYERFGDDDIERQGYAVYADPGNQPYWCEIHTLEPQRADDEKMDTMGHELSHCVFGQFHENPGDES